MRPRQAIPIVLAFLGAASCAEDGSAPAPPKAPRPNIVLICLDTVRADAIDAHGDEPAAMPALARFCSSATHFIDASAPASWTAPCVASLLTGLSPEHHGVHGEAQAPALVQSVMTLAERLKAAGYTTAAFTGGGWVSAEMGLNQGFDTYYGTTSEAFTLEDRGSHLADWVRTCDRSKPYFLFIHTYEAHDPYGRKRPPEGYDDKAAVERVRTYAENFRSQLATPPTDEMPAGVDGAELLTRWRSEPLFREAFLARPGVATMDRIVFRYMNATFATDPRRPEIEARLRARYRHGLGLLDTGFAKLLETLAPIAPPASTVVIVDTDHGESLGEHAFVGHGRWLTDVLTRVILAVRAPDRVPKGVIRGSATHADVVPTVLEWCGIAAPADIDGVSLLALATGARPGRPVVAEENRREFGATGDATLRLVAVRDERQKFIATYDPRTGLASEQLFDLVVDGAEEHPLPVGDLTPRGVAFVEAVARVRARVESFKSEGR